jgi:hypothetical protein
MMDKLNWHIKKQTPVIINKRRIIGLKRELLFFVMVICVLQFVLCTSDYNPFQDNSLARAIVISELQSNDSLKIYSSQNLTLLLTDVNQIEQVRVQAAHNRWFLDTTIGSKKFDLSAPVKLDFSISFFDTGWQEIKISTLLKNGEKICDSVRLYSIQTLSQPYVSANSGEQFTLETRPVKDEKVIYNWMLGNVKIESNTAKTVERINAFCGSGNGELWVCDNFGNNSSPHITFRYSLFDTVPPVIKCINDIAIFNKDTIVTSDSAFHLLLNITDNGSSTIIAEIDSQTFSRVESPLFVKLIENVKDYTEPHPFSVSASDGRNISKKTFFVKYDSDAKQEKNLPEIIIITPQEDSIAASQKLYRVSGKIRKNLSSQDSVVLKIKLNNITGKDEKRVKVTEVDSIWFFDIQLVQGVNSIEISALDTGGLLICSKNVVLVYDRDYEDTRAPQIVELSLDHTPIQSELPQNAVPYKSPKLRIIAFDDGSGIKQVLVNKKDITNIVSADGYSWEDSVYLTHENYQRYTIEVVDHSGNTTLLPIDLRYNNPPQIKQEFVETKTLKVGSTYSERLPVSDMDDDQLTFKKIFGPEKMTVQSVDSLVSWTPTISDTGRYYVQISASDSFSNTIVTFTIIVKENLLPLQLKTTERVFPSVIESDDTINLPILVDSMSGTPPFKFSATATGGSLCSFNANQLSWHPDTSDTGCVQLSVKVADLDGQSVTLYPVIRVIPAIEKISFSCSYTGDTSGNGCLDLKKYGNVSDTLKLQIVDPYKQYRTYTADVAYGMESATHYTIEKSGRLNVRLDKNRKNAGMDSLTITITDQFSHKSVIKKQIDYGVLLNPEIVSPKADIAISDSTVVLRWTRSGEDSSILYRIFLSRVDSVITSPTSETFDTSIIVKLSKKGTYYSQVFAVKNDTTIRSAIKTFKIVPHESILITYDTTSFRSFLTVGKDSMNLALVVKNNHGPYTFTKTGLFADNFSIDNSGILKFKPLETGTCSLEVVVQDSDGCQDTLVTPEILVIPLNRPCSLSVTPEIDSIIPIGSQAVTYKFKIEDPDSLFYEGYRVSVHLFTMETDVKVDSTGSFSVIIDPSELSSGYDSLRVIVTDKGGFSDTISAKINSAEQKIQYLSPADGETVNTNPVHLAWNVNNSGDTLPSYTVSLDTNSSPVKEIGSFLTPNCDISGLEAGTVYYWRVVAFVGSKIIVGTVQRFITAPPIPITGP